MTDRELIKAELQNLQKILEAKADMCIGNGKVNLLSFANACSGALELLKEQEAKWVHREDMDFIDKNKRTHFHGMCTNCGFVHDFIDGHTGQYKYCPQCGKAVKWDD